MHSIMNFKQNLKLPFFTTANVVSCATYYLQCDSEMKVVLFGFVLRQLQPHNVKNKYV